MPFARIDLSNDYPEGSGQQVGEIIYGALQQYLNVPENDKFQVITRHDNNELVTPKTYLGIEYSDDIIFIQVTLNEGRTTEMKKSFYNDKDLQNVYRYIKPNFLLRNHSFVCLSLRLLLVVG